MSTTIDIAKLPGIRLVDIDVAAQAAPPTRPSATLPRERERGAAQEPEHRINWRTLSEKRRARIEAEFRVRDRAVRHWGAMRSMAPWFRRRQIALAMAAAKELGQW